MTRQREGRGLTHNRFHYASGQLARASLALTWLTLMGSVAGAQTTTSTPTDTAQVAPPDPAVAAPDEEAEEIVVTGSRIARSSLTSYGNIEVIDSEQLAQVGAVTVDDLLRRLPSITLQGLAANNNNGGLGYRTLELRNLGDSRTLILVNGRRYIQQGTIFQSQFVDVNDIPVQLIERVEILFDGASAIYGSDAVAGVINFVLKDEFEGLEVETQIGVSSRGDGEQIAVTVTGGASNPRGNIVMSVNYTGYEEVSQGDRDWGREAPLVAFFNNGDNAANGITNLYGSSFVPESRVGGTFFRPDPSTGLSFQPFTSLGPDQRYNFASEQLLFGSQDRFMIHALGKYEIIDPTPNFTMEAYLEANFAHRTTRTQLAPQPITGEVSVPITNPNIPADYLATLDPGTTSLSMNRRMVDVGNRIFELQSFSFRQLIGLRGEFLENFRYDVYGQYVRNRNWQTTFNSIDAAQANRGAGTADWFGPPGSDGLSPDEAEFFRYEDVTESADDMFNLAATIGWEPFAIPLTKKKVNLVLGYERRDQNGLNRPDSITQRGDASGNFATETSGSFEANEVFAELLVPLISDFPLIHDLGVDGAVRYSNFNESGDLVTGRVRGRYAPIEDLAFRGTYSTAFRAPNIGELFGGTQESFEVLADPCDDLGTTGPGTDTTIGQNCLADGVPIGYDQQLQQGTQISTNIGGNDDLEAETSQMAGVGVVLTSRKLLPKQFGELSATFDYYTYEIDDAIDTVSGQIALDQCYSSPGRSSPFCDLITRGAGGGGQITNFDLRLQNVAQIYTNGIDFGVNYGYDLAEVGLEDFGRLDFSFRGNHLINYELTPFENATEDEIQDLEGTGDSSQGVYPALTWRMQAMWSVNRFAVAAFWTYIDSMALLGVDPADPFSEVGEVTYTDLSLSYTEDRWQVTAGINNLTDESPPFVLGGFANSFPEAYDFYGRYFFLRGKYTF